MPYDPNEDLKLRKAEFDKLNQLATLHNAWLTSVPGALVVTLECLPGSPLPDLLRSKGWLVEKTGTRERMLANQITEKLTKTSCGIFEFATEGSTKKVALRITHAGPATVDCFDLR